MGFRGEGGSSRSWTQRLWTADISPYCQLPLLVTSYHDDGDDDNDDDDDDDIFCDDDE